MSCCLGPADKGDGPERQGPNEASTLKVPLAAEAAAGTENSACVCTAVMCAQHGCDGSGFTLGAKGEEECLCCYRKACCAFDEDPLGCGVTTPEGEICSLALLFCIIGLKKPTVLCDAWGRCLWCQSSASLPMRPKSSVPEPHCAYCGISCLPVCGCCLPPAKPIPAKLSTPANVTMTRK